MLAVWISGIRPERTASGDPAVGRHELTSAWLREALGTDAVSSLEEMAHRAAKAVAKRRTPAILSGHGGRVGMGAAEQLVLPALVVSTTCCAEYDVLEREILKEFYRLTDRSRNACRAAVRCILAAVHIMRNRHRYAL